MVSVQTRAVSPAGPVSPEPGSPAAVTGGHVCLSGPRLPGGPGRGLAGRSGSGSTERLTDWRGGVEGRQKWLLFVHPVRMGGPGPPATATLASQVSV